MSDNKYIKVRVMPGAKKESVTKVNEDTLKIDVREKPERNLANRRIVEIVAKEYGVGTNRVQIINGHTSRSKIISIRED